jgi:cytoskeleton protein RodZ
MPDNEPAPGEAEPTGGPGIGERLRAAREQRGLSIDQLAECLRLDEVVVAALEADDFDALGAPVFVRGHLKTCARFLELDVDELLGDYAAAAPEPVVRSVSSGAGSGVPITISLLPWGAGALGVLMAIGLTVYLLQGDPDVAPGAAAPTPAQSAGSTEAPSAPQMPPVEAPAAAAPPVAAPPVTGSPSISGGNACQLCPQFMHDTCRPLPVMEPSGSW